MGDVVDLPVTTTLDIPADKVLAKAVEAGLATAVVIGWEPDGRFYFASSASLGPEVLWLLETAKINLLDTAMSD